MKKNDRPLISQPGRSFGQEERQPTKVPLTGRVAVADVLGRALLGVKIIVSTMVLVKIIVGNAIETRKSNFEQTQTELDFCDRNDSQNMHIVCERKLTRERPRRYPSSRTVRTYVRTTSVHGSFTPTARLVWSTDG